jgi:hypothetical protein
MELVEGLLPSILVRFPETALDRSHIPDCLALGQFYFSGEDSRASNKVGAFPL